VTLIRISLRPGKPADYRQAIAENVYESLRETFNVPESDFFATVDELESRDFIYDRKYFDIERSDDLVLIQLTVSNTRTVGQKNALYRRIVERLGKSLALRPQDIFLNLLKVAKENWSFGNGDAQYAYPRPAVIGWQQKKNRGKTGVRSYWEFLMSCYAQTKTNAAFAASRAFSLRRVFNRAVERLRAAHQRRKQCQELIDYLASDHRASQDLGITICEARRLCR